MKTIKNTNFIRFIHANSSYLPVSKSYYVYKIVAIPISFNKHSFDLLRDYNSWFRNSYFAKWDGDTKTTSSYKNNELTVSFKDSVLSSTGALDDFNILENVDQLDIFLDVIDFLPTLYLGITENIKKRFNQHTNPNKEDSTINKMLEIAILEKCELYFIWNEVNSINEKLTFTKSRKVLEDLEYFLIQTNNPIFNIRKRS